MLTQRPTPAFLSQEAARRLPRFALPLLLAAFILSGFWATGLWTTRDAAGFGTAHEMAVGGLEEWLLPQIQGVWETGFGPLAGWTAALFMKVLSGVLGEVGAYRTASVFWFLLSVSALWSAVWRLSRRAEAQPVAFAFGGQADPASYAHVAASCAVLFFVATFGITTRQYEPIADTALVALAAVALAGCAHSLRRPFAGAFITGLAAGAGMLTTSIAASLWLLGAGLIVHAAVRTLPGRRAPRMILVLAGAVMPLALWGAAAHLAFPEHAPLWFAQWLGTQSTHVGPVSAAAVLWLSRTFVWYLLPTWPLALWALYSWRRQLDRTQILIPAIFAGAAVAAGFFTSQAGAGDLMLILVAPCCVLATYGLVTLRHSRDNLLDWFAISVFSVALLTLWLYWIAALIGFPPKMAKSIAMLAPELDLTLNGSVVLPLVSCVLWISFVVWRLTHRPIVVWRGAWLSAAGMTAFAVTLLGLWHEGIDMNRSYAQVSVEIAEAARRLSPEDPRLSADEIRGGVRAMLHHYGRVTFTRPGEPAKLRLVRVRGDRIPEGTLAGPISRPHTDETFYITAVRR